MFDMNGDGYDDLICHTSDGRIQISESHIVDQMGKGYIVEETNKEGNTEGSTESCN